ncbi:hypothetical protein M406DRAFT_107810 [Cryphonectria parasitica EP155]|uniref:Uncharacterized protein n=1 Tax=Cryphonectria parasitica (strain ATCC 38755 / EP155) TaxID=660469 RepID=A0A9P5CLX1_CRYP1|nr:uncharacterized protein M406DRAFT_107810 [Cryphonectria parasitica EP155]KAF3762260.1 hypothetical protein M406DRAFT_107810 [Cryphonectria parasitica EP155]
MFILGLVGRIVNEVTGQSQRDQNRFALAQANNPQRTQPTTAAAPYCTCRGRRSCAQCAYEPAVAYNYPYADDYGYGDYHHPYLSRRDVRREYRQERRALKATRKAARRGYGYPVTVPVGAGGYAGAAGAPVGGNGFGYARDRRYDGEEAMAGPSLRAVRPGPEQRGRRASFDAGHLRRSDLEEDKDEEDLPPQYERGNWQPQMRRSAEVLTTEGK